MTTESNLDEPRSGVRSYRGRTLEEILPQIRAELGADAVILREREGLVGGVGGFFAQRFIEVEARRGDGQSIDVYDDAPEDDLRAYPGGSAGTEPFGSEPQTLIPPDPAEIRVTKPEIPDEAPETQALRALPTPRPTARSEPRPFIPPSVQIERTAPASAPEPTPWAPAAARRFETGIFMERLREASASLPRDLVELGSGAPQEGSPSAVPPPAVTPPPPGIGPNPAQGSLNLPQTHRVAADEQAEIDAALAELATPGRKPRPPQARAKSPEGRTPKPPRPGTRAGARRSARSLAAPEPFVAPPAPGAAPTPAPPNPYQSVRERPAALALAPPAAPPVVPPTAPPRPSRPAPRAEKVAGSGIGPRKYTAPPPRVVIEPSQRRRSSENVFRAALSRLLGRRKAIVLRPPPPQPLDLVAAGEVSKDLSRRGASQSWTAELISAAGAHGNPLTGSLREAAEAEVARRILPAPPLPATGAAIAFIGAGGSGKTRCTAAMASAYRRGSTLTVTVVALDNPDGARELRKLLADDGVPVVSLSGDRAREAIEAGRQGGLVIVDTAAATPTDPDAVEALRAKLDPLELDATYVTLPATLGPSAARRVLASFGTLSPAAVTITHADETDQLAVVVEIAINHRIPLAYFHSGTDHVNALSAIDPPAIAQELLP